MVGQLGAAARTGREVAFDGRGLVGLDGVECVRSEELL
jgi:hypothetical protein